MKLKKKKWNVKDKIENRLNIDDLACNLAFHKKKL